MGNLKNWLMIIEYDGARYCGWQTQPNGPSIEAELVGALKVMLREPVKITGAGRTDAGVHARGQAANFRTEVDLEPDRLRWQLNAVLPKDIVVRRIHGVPDDFDARRSASSRTYSYAFLNRPYPSAFLSRHSWWVSRPLAIDEMQAGAAALIGSHDFSGFTVAKEGPMTRNVKSIEITEADSGGLVVIRITANAFLHHMVRLIVGTLIEVGVGKLPASAVGEILVAADVRRAGPRAPAKGLTLERVEYEGFRAHLEP